MKAFSKVFGQVSRQKRLSHLFIVFQISSIFLFSSRAVIYVAQFMGFMPIQGIRTGNPFKFEFKWKTFRVMITLLYLVLGVSTATMYLQRIARIGITAKNIGE